MSWKNLCWKYIGEKTHVKMNSINRNYHRSFNFFKDLKLTRCCLSILQATPGCNGLMTSNQKFIAPCKLYCKTNTNKAQHKSATEPAIMYLLRKCFLKKSANWSNQNARVYLFSMFSFCSSWLWRLARTLKNAKK